MTDENKKWLTLADALMGSVHPRRILEIGPGKDLSTARWLKKRYGCPVTVLDKWGSSSEQECEGIEYVRGDATAMPFDTGSFDMVVGIFVLEHIHPLDRMAAEVRRVLTGDGTAYLTGGALWSSHKGHHLWVNANGRRYRFNDESNVVPDWTHLLHSEDSLAAVCQQVLEQRGLRREQAFWDAKEIASQVLNKPELNRLRASEIRDCFVREFRKIHTSVYRSHQPEPDVLRNLRRICRYEDWTIYWMGLLLRKD